jgi:hypothetical protein
VELGVVRCGEDREVIGGLGFVATTA